MKNIIFLPFYGEFGWLVMSHLRYIEWVQADAKIVCCEPGQELLFPSATGFFTDYSPPIDDSDRCGSGSYKFNWKIEEFDRKLASRLSALYPDHEIHRPHSYDCPWHMSDFIKPKLRATKMLPAIDVAIGVRQRQFQHRKNWQHWQFLADVLHNNGLTIGLVGRRDTSFDFAAEAKAWDHIDGDTAGSINILQNCRLYVGSDSGISHLASLFDTPSVVFRLDTAGNDDLRGVMRRANKRYFQKVPDEAWHRPDEIVGIVFRCLGELRGGFDEKPQFPFWGQNGGDRWIKENLKLPDVGTFCEVGAHDGVSGSNTMHFEMVGWSGVVVEPDFRQHSKLKNNRRASKVFTCAAGRYEGTAVFHQQEHAQLSGFLRTDGSPIRIAVKTLTQILEAAALSNLDLLSIDTEGTELDVWDGLDLNRFKPTVVIVEYDTIGLPDRSAEIRRRITECGYTPVKDIGGNLIFVRNQ